MTALESSWTLDDRDHDRLMAEALGLVAARGGEWNDLGPSDPGVVLLESFAHLTEVLLYRVNRLPRQVRRELLGLLGIRLRPAAAAHVEVMVERDAGDGELLVPGGTRLSTDGDPRLAFLLRHDVVLAPGQTSASGRADHVDQHTGVLLGASTGQPGQAFRLPTSVVAATGHELDLVIGVEADPDTTAASRRQGRLHDGVTYERWDVVPSFADRGDEDRVCTVDRASGLVTFAPAGETMTADGRPVAMGAVPPAGRQVRAWYRSGGGAVGNVAAGALRRLEPEVPDVRVHNPARAVGGRDAETVDGAVRRATTQLQEPLRAVTADDVEALARRVRGVSRAHATTEAERWRHAVAGSVDVRIVADVGAAAAGADLAALRDAQQQAVLDEVADAIRLAQPLGVRSEVGWAGLKEVRVHLRVVVSPGEDPEAVRERVTSRLHDELSPVPVPGVGPGWPFGQALRASNVYDVALREPGVRYADDVAFEVALTPSGRVGAIAADRHQAGVWYAGDGPVLYRSEDDAVGWEAMQSFDDGEIRRIVSAPDRPGAVAVVVAHERRSSLLVSLDCGSTMLAPVASFGWTADERSQTINDVCWLPAGAHDDLVLATDRGLYLARIGARTRRPWTIAPEDPDRGCWAVTPIHFPDGRVLVAAAMRAEGGVWIADVESDTFTMFGLDRIDVRRLVVEERGNRRFLWAPAFAVGEDRGTGCHRAEVIPEQAPPLAWTHLDRGWEGGICHDLAFLGDEVLAATHRSGVLRRRGADPADAWVAPSVERSGLPLDDTGRFHPATALDAGPGGALTGTDRGVLRTVDGTTFVPAATRLRRDLVTLPPSWLFASGDHVVRVEVDTGAVARDDVTRELDR